MFVNKTQNLLKNVFQRTGQLREMSVVRQSLKYCQFGEPAEVLQIVEDNLCEPKDDEILVKMLMAPINPADINTIQGKYPVKPAFPAIGGNEFVGVVEKVGKNIQKFKLGQRVVPAVNALGSWTTHGIFTKEQLMCVSHKIGLVEAATITVNPCTAYRMLKDFVPLKPGDCVIQNGANSAVGQSVHQLCRAWELKSVGIVRDRPDIKCLKEYLKALGANEVFTEEEMCATDIFKNGCLPKPKLALNCVGGKNATEVSRHLAPGGIIVTYGGMSRQPVMIGTAALIFKDIAFRGFWITRWTEQNAQEYERDQMFDELSRMMTSGKFGAPKHQLVPMTNYKEAVKATLNSKGFTGIKYLFDMTCM